MKIIVATKETQGERADDFCFTREAEIVMLDDCDELHPGCDCKRSMVGVQSGKGTTTMMVIESDVTHDEFVRRIKLANKNAGFAMLLSDADSVFAAEADELLKLASQFPSGAIIERDDEEFTRRA